MLEFGYTRQTDRTETFLEYLSTKHLHILNDPDALSSFVQGRLSGRSDLTLGDNEIRDHFWISDSGIKFVRIVIKG